MNFKTVSVAVLSAAMSAFAGPIFNGGTGAIVFGVAPYGGSPNVGGPTYIADNITGYNDILTSPGLGTLGGYVTASPVVGNNINSTGSSPLPLADSQSGGSNANGAFGAGSAFDSGTSVAFSLSDSGAGGGSASYIITGGNSTYTIAGAPVAAGTTYGSYVGIGGAVPLVGNADIVALIVHFSDTAGVFGANGTTAPQEVLAISRNGAGAGIGNYNIVAIGGAAGGNAALILDNGVTGAFRAAAVDSTVLGAALPVGDVITVSWALTAFTDPANFSTIDLGTDLLNLTGPLPTDTFFSTSVASVPEPGMWLLMASGLAGIWLFGTIKKAGAPKCNRL